MSFMFVCVRIGFCGVLFELKLCSPLADAAKKGKKKGLKVMDEAMHVVKESMSDTGGVGYFHVGPHQCSTVIGSCHDSFCILWSNHRASYRTNFECTGE